MSAPASVLQPDERTRPATSGGLLRTILLGLFLIPGTVFFGSTAVLAGILGWAGFFRFSIRGWSRGILFCSGTRIEIRDLAALDPRRRVVFLCNHQSALDIPILVLATARTHDARFMAKESLFKIPFLGWGIARNGFVPINRDSARNAAEKFQKILEQKDALPYSYLIFPEGTRSPDGRLQPLKRGTLGLALRLGLPVVPVSVADACRANPKGALRVRSGTVVVTFHPLIELPADPGDRDFRDALVERVHATIASALPPEQQPAPGSVVPPAE